jgi:hypothetical protein
MFPERHLCTPRASTLFFFFLLLKVGVIYEWNGVGMGYRMCYLCGFCFRWRCSRVRVGIWFFALVFCLLVLELGWVGSFAFGGTLFAKSELDSDVGRTVGGLLV